MVCTQVHSGPEWFAPRYTVILNGYEAIREALVKTDFAGRSEMYIEKNILNPEKRGLSESHA